MRTTGLLGEVGGLASDICRRHRVQPRAVYQSHLDELKELMRQGAGRQGLPNNQRYNEGGTLGNPPNVN